METNSLIIQKIKKLSFFETEESIRYELYAIFTSIILAKNVFSRNKDIMNFLKNFDIEFRPYIVRSRTLILSNVLRIINEKDIQELKIMQKKLITIYEQYIKYGNDKDEKNGYVGNILKKYSRNNNNV